MVSILNKGSGLARVKIEKGSKDTKVESKGTKGLKKKKHVAKKKSNSNKKSGAINLFKSKLKNLKCLKIGPVSISDMMAYQFMNPFIADNQSMNVP